MKLVTRYRFTESIDQSKPTQPITKWLTPWLEDQGFFRGVSERSVYCHPDRDLLILLYLDYVMAKGESEQIEWFLKLPEEHCECKKADYIGENTPQDYLGMIAGKKGNTA